MMVRVLGDDFPGTLFCWIRVGRDDILEDMNYYIHQVNTHLLSGVVSNLVETTPIIK